MDRVNNPGEPNRDPITGAPGAHPVGTGMGAAAGGMAGKGVAEMVDPTVEDAYWKDSYTKESYYADGKDFDFYAPAYRTGYEGRARYDGKSFDEVETDLEADYRRHGKNRDTPWEDVKQASRAAWNRIDSRVQSATRN